MQATEVDDDTQNTFKKTFSHFIKFNFKLKMNELIFVFEPGRAVKLPFTNLFNKIQIQTNTH